KRETSEKPLPPDPENTRPFNAYGLPTISTPCGFSKDGLPRLVCKSVGRISRKPVFWTKAVRVRVKMEPVSSLGERMRLRRALMLLGLALGAAVASPAQVSFNRDIRPIMADTCFRCHGPDRNARMAGLRLDIRDEALKPKSNGSAPIVPGNPDQR